MAYGMIGLVRPICMKMGKTEPRQDIIRLGVFKAKHRAAAAAHAYFPVLGKLSVSSVLTFPVTFGHCKTSEVTNYLEE